MASPNEPKPEVLRVAVWGASGFIGRHVVATLLERGHCARGLTRHSDRVPTDGSGRLETRVLDFRASTDTLRRALEGTSCAVYCAGHAHAGPHEQQEYVASVGNLAQAAGDCGLDRFILLSSVAVYGSRQAGLVGVETELNPDTPYGRSRGMAEDAARETLSRSNTRLTIFRVPAVVGADMRSDVLRHVFRSLRSGFFLHPGRAESVFPCVGVQRLAACVAGVAEAGNSDLPPILQLADCFRWIDLANLYASMTGYGYIRVALPGRAIRRICGILGLDFARPLEALDGRICYEDNSTPPAMKNHVPDTLRDIRELIGQLG